VPSLLKQAEPKQVRQETGGGEFELSAQKHSMIVEEEKREYLPIEGWIDSIASYYF
jgi:hypothetical protein